MNILLSHLKPNQVIHLFFPTASRQCPLMAISDIGIFLIDKSLWKINQIISRRWGKNVKNCTVVEKQNRSVQQIQTQRVQLTWQRLSAMFSFVSKMEGCFFFSFFTENLVHLHTAITCQTRNKCRLTVTSVDKTVFWGTTVTSGHTLLLSHSLFVFSEETRLIVK